MFSITLKKSVVLSVLAGLMAFAVSAEAKGAPSVARLDRRGGAGKIALQTKSRASLPGDASVEFARVRGDNARAKIADGLAKSGVLKAARPTRQGRGGLATSEAARPAGVLAMYDVSIKSSFLFCSKYLISSSKSH